MPFDDFTSNRKPNTSAWVLLGSMQTLEDHKNLFGIFWIDTNSVVTYKDKPAILYLADANMNARRFLPFKLDCVADQILKQLHQLQIIPKHGRQGLVSDDGIIRLDDQVQIIRNTFQSFLQFDLCKLLIACAHLRIREQIRQQVFHAIRSFEGITNELVRIFIQLALIPTRQKLYIIRYQAQWLLQIMRSHIAKLLEFLVRAL